ncbi:MAG: methylenetetrahydrofolate--tRNA-(uracil(54)-C(5))-methyltransferase (FADH(2)-oxidizing) TrmFO [Coriobacteriia bacterium]|nr:methylenetetrahydrofolate--tRNA-(uracil(54)-C(5))-methyltransferase (FADH(2)-oxidizing) TrmFO [Coriobacteriia bacterium]
MSVNLVKIIGAGLAGSEAALVLANAGVKVKLYEMRPKKQTLVHNTGNAAELVCSNSFKSTKKNSAAGMLKAELAALDSPLYKIALQTKIDAGMALAVDRDLFSKAVTELIEDSDNIELVREEAKGLNPKELTIIASGPLTSDNLSDSLQKITGDEELAFYDAAAPIVMADSIDTNIIFSQDRYDEGSGDYLNAPMNKSEYTKFIEALISAKCVIKKDFETKDLFQACQPVEEVAKSGFDAPRYGAMKPVGLTDPRTGKRPYAVVQLRAENKEKTAYNLVGFQTNLTFSEQKCIFRMIPGLENAEFARYGVMHRNTFINAPKLLNTNLKLKGTNIYVAGQLSGTEGYLEAVRSGHQAALSILGCEVPPQETAFGALLDYATNPDTKNYQPMHVNFGIVPPIKEKNKKLRYEKYASRGAAAMEDYVRKIRTTN